MSLEERNFEKGGSGIGGCVEELDQFFPGFSSPFGATPPSSPLHDFNEILPPPMLDELFSFMNDNMELDFFNNLTANTSRRSKTSSTSDDSFSTFFDKQFLKCDDAPSCSSFISPPPTNPPSPQIIKSEDPEDNFLHNFQLFDSFEKFGDFEHNLMKDEDEPPLKKVKQEPEDFFNESTWQEDALGFSSDYDPLGLMEEESGCGQPEVKNEVEDEDEGLENSRNAVWNDHSYAANDASSWVDNEVEVKEEEGAEGEDEDFSLNINFDKISKKTTKILVPLQHLMETLQRKNFLVSPLGPGKKIIKLTGAGDSVKGVLQSSILQVTSPQQTTTTTSKPNHNVRKRPHAHLLNKNNYPKLMEPATPPEPKDPLCNSPPIATKKKTKAHNNMERLRRVDLRNSFDNLKKLVPILAKSPKCSKVEILRKAEEFIRGMRQQEKKLIKEKEALRLRQEALKLRI